MDFISFGRAVGDPKRLAILQGLGRTGLSIEDIAASAGIARSTACHHIAVLKAAGLVKRRRKGHRVIYSWSPARWVLVDEATLTAGTAIWNGYGT